MDQTQKARAVELVEFINSLGFGCALVGGLAVSVRTRPRATQDVDLAVAVSTDKDAERVGFQLCQHGYRLRDTLEDTNTGYVSTLRLNHPRDPHDTEEPSVDLLFSSSGIEGEVVAAASSIRSLSGGEVPVAQLPHLIAMKVLSECDERPKDREDLRALIRAASKAQLDQATELVVLIEQRGYHRNKELQPLLCSLIRQHQARGHSE